MRDDYHARSPDRGRTHETSQRRDRDDYHHDEPYRDDESYHRSRHGHYSRSPSRRNRRDGDNRSRARSRDWDHQHHQQTQSRPGNEHTGHQRDFDRQQRQDQHDYSDMYDERPRRDDYQDRYHPEEDQDSRSQSYSRGHSRGQREDPGPRTDTVILEGLPTELGSDELREGILHTLKNLRLPSFDLRLPQARGGRRAFVQFQTIDDAAAFMADQFPTLLVTLSDASDDHPDNQFTASMHYARGRENDLRAAVRPNWNCPQCTYSNYATRNKCKQCGTSEPVLRWEDNLTGPPDVGQEPSQILVVYPLPVFVSEDMFTNDIKKLEKDIPKIKAPDENGPKLKSTAPSNNPAGYGARPGSIHRVFLMRDRRTQEFFKYGFVEFWTVEDAMAAITKFQAATGFTVAGGVVNVGYTHMGVFLPVQHEPIAEEEHLSFRPLFNPGIRVEYRDHHVYPSQRVVTAEAPQSGDAANTRGSSSNSSISKSKKRRTENDTDDQATKKRQPMVNQLARWQQRHDELHDSNGKKEENTKIKISLSNSIKLGGTAPLPDPPADKLQMQDIKTADNQSADESQVGTTSKPVTNREKLTCYLCMRQLKELRFLDAHEKSEKHLELMKDLTKVTAAQEKVQRSLVTKPKSDETASAAEYRDRAKERRTAHNQPNKPKPPPSQPESVLPEPEEIATKPVVSKGAAMLEKLGYKAGSGLGANGEGRVDVIATNLYQEGVGLGAEGSNLGDASKEAERKTKGSYKDYLESVNDRARQRFQNL